MTRSHEYFNSLDIEREGITDEIFRIEREHLEEREYTEYLKSSIFVGKPRKASKYGTTKAIVRKSSPIRKVTKKAGKHKSPNLQRDDRNVSLY